MLNVTTPRRVAMQRVFFKLIPPIIGVFVRFRVVQNLADCPHLEHLIPIVGAN
jgi:hypothetical protein